MYGYNAFRLDITPYVKAGENEVRVLLNNQEESSRWYPGAGLYRPVTLITAGDARIDPWATVFKTLSLAGNKAQLYVETQATTAKGKGATRLAVRLLDANGRLVAQKNLAANAQGTANAQLNIANAKAWSRTALPLHARNKPISRQQAGRPSAPTCGNTHCVR